MQLPYDCAWYIVYTKPLLEKKVTKCLEKLKIAYYHPMKKIRQQQHSEAVINRPLFPSYVFIYTHEGGLESLKKIKGVIGLVHRKKYPAVIPCEEISSIRDFLESYDNVFTEKMALSSTRPVPATEAPAAGAGGLNHVARLPLPSLGTVLAAIISLEAVKAVPNDVLPHPAYRQEKIIAA